MYSLYLSNKLQNGNHEETLIYSSKIPSEHIALISPSLDVESGAAGSLDFTMPPSNVGYNLVEMMRTEVIFKIDDEEKWRGRVLNTDSDFYNQMKVECEGEMSYLNDTYQPQKEYDDLTLTQYLGAILDIHNQKVTDSNGDPVGPIDKRFSLGAVYVDDVASATVSEMFRKTDYDTTMSCLKTVANTYKARFIVRWQTDSISGVRTRYLDFVKDFIDTCSQSIDFGRNLLDFNKSYKMQELCTVAIPIGAKMEDKAGDEITLYDTENNQQINYLGSDGQFGYDSQDTYRYARVCYLNTGEFKVGDKIYVSVAQTEDTMSPISKDGIWCFAAEDGQLIANTLKKWSGTPLSGEVETYEKYELTIPAGAQRFRVGGNIHYQPEIKVYRQKAKERVDECYTIESVPTYDDGVVQHTEGNIYIVHKSLFEQYGWHEKKLSFGDLDESQKLNDLAVEYLKKTQFTQMTLELTALDLSTLNTNYEKIWINMNVPIYSKPHGIEYGALALPCTKIKIKLDSPEDNSYTLGWSSSDQISDTQSNVSADISGLMDEIPAVSTTLAAAKENATQLLDAFANAGEVVFVKNPNNPNEISEILIYTGSQDPSQATKRWRWNMGGLGYQEYVNGAWQTVDAMTADGAIVANRITTGSLYADRIRGGTLHLGHTEILNPDGTGSGVYTDGYIDVKDNSNNSILTIEKDYGLTTNGNDAWMRIKNGHLYGSGYGSPAGYTPINYDGENCSGIINLNNWFDGTPGLDIRTRAFGINSDSIYVSDGLDGNAKVGQSVWVTIGDKRLKFVKGILWGVDDLSNQGGD